ncbi:hypothetical protein FVE85_2058 [Porphyridium purpureum]|uniref:Uncharacterized protein n=1 Tax=Porphyridium purpureum TaxID=35688 RepID=A0A5J4YZ46_PORPP|nr:hypothetical protein FVE85_2058 [Porphyridium purpureum]|eukprot:POR5775..scf209_3
MGVGSLTVLVGICGAAALYARPKDVPRYARMAGYGLGRLVSLLRVVKEYGEKAAASSTFGPVTTQIREGLTQLTDIHSQVRGEFIAASPFRSRVVAVPGSTNRIVLSPNARPDGDAGGDDGGMAPAKTEDAPESKSGEFETFSPLLTKEFRSTAPSSGQKLYGADFVALCQEEAALVAVHPDLFDARSSTLGAVKDSVSISATATDSSNVERGVP